LVRRRKISDLDVRWSDLQPSSRFSFREAGDGKELRSDSMPREGAARRLHIRRPGKIAVSRRVLLMSCLILVLEGICPRAGLVAGKPVPPPPPPPPVDPTLIYEHRPDLGGWLDTSRNLLWGTYSVTVCTGGAEHYDDCAALAADYSGTLTFGAAQYDALSSQYQAFGDQYAVSNPTLAAKYYGYAQDYAAAADELLANSQAASVVEGANRWRMPSKDEFVDAYNKGMFTYGDGGLNAFDTSPVPGIQPQVAHSLYWTTTPDKGNRSQWAYDPPAGLSQSVLTSGSYLFALAVRNYTPPAP